MSVIAAALRAAAGLPEPSLEQLGLNPDLIRAVKAAASRGPWQPPGAGIPSTTPTTAKPLAASTPVAPVAPGAATPTKAFAFTSVKTVTPPADAGRAAAASWDDVAAKINFDGKRASTGFLAPAEHAALRDGTAPGLAAVPSTRPGEKPAALRTGASVWDEVAAKINAGGSHRPGFQTPSNRTSAAGAPTRTSR